MVSALKNFFIAVSVWEAYLEYIVLGASQQAQDGETKEEGRKKINEFNAWQFENNPFQTSTFLLLFAQIFHVLWIVCCFLCLKIHEHLFLEAVQLRSNFLWVWVHYF